MRPEGKLGLRLPAWLERFKYPALILLLGLGLLLWPTRGEAVPEPQPEQSLPASPMPEEDPEAYARRMERQLEALLSQIDGAGSVQVMLSLKTGVRTEYQSDSVRTQRPEGEGTALSREEKTVMQSQGSAYNEAVVVTRAFPAFQGALIVAEGGGEDRVRLSICSAVAALLGLGADQITVLKMK